MQQRGSAVAAPRGLFMSNAWLAGLSGFFQITYIFMSTALIVNISKRNIDDIGKLDISSSSV